MADGMTVSVREAPPLFVIDLSGEVTTFSEEAIVCAYRYASTRGARNVLLNFAGVEYLNSAGIAIVIGVLTETRRADQRLQITGLTPHYRKIFQMMGIAQYVPIYDSEEAAREAVLG